MCITDTDISSTATYNYALHTTHSGLRAGYNMAITTRASRPHPDRETGSSSSSSSSSDAHINRTLSGTGASPHDSLAAAANRIGSYPRLYTHQPMFRSHLESLDILVEGVGELDSSVRTVGVWVQGQAGGGRSPGGIQQKQPPPGEYSDYARGLVYYLRGSKVVGVLLWNASDLRQKVQDVVAQQPSLHSIDDLKTLVALAPNDWLNLIETNSSIEPDSSLMG
jgi:Apoptosis-inducing factor, mitochondrion-associated, C-term